MMVDLFLAVVVIGVFFIVLLLIDAWRTFDWWEDD